MAKVNLYDPVVDLEQSVLAAVRRAADEFRMNGNESMALTMVQAEREVRELAARARYRKNQA